MKFKCINGWTKEKMKRAIRIGNMGYPAMDYKEDACVYLAPDGNKCAVGCFIPDGHDAQSSIDSAIHLIQKYPELDAVMPLTALGMSQMQCQHDGYEMFRDSNSDMRVFLCDWIEKNCED